MSWATFLDSAPAGEHAVQIYEDVADLAASVVRYAAAAANEHEPLLVIATPDHQEVFARELLQARYDAVELERTGLLTRCDARTTLDAVLEDGAPSRELFEQTVGGLVDRIVQRHPGKTIRAFGEMVDILWQQGAQQAALVLEELWNKLAATRPLALLCGYELDLFDADVQTAALPRIFRAHTHPRPVADAGRLAAAVDKALVEVVGPVDAGHIYLDVAEQVPRTIRPRAHAVLMWLSEQRSATAKLVLDRARVHYAG